MNGMGGFDYAAIQVTFDMNGILQGCRPGLFLKIVKLMDVIRSEQKKREK
jgi:hypothetical protein